MKFVRLHKPLGTPVLLNLDNVDYFELDSQDISAVANMKNGDRVTLMEKLDEIEHVCVMAGGFVANPNLSKPPALKPPPSRLRA
jgi:hypothetical protein